MTLRVRHLVEHFAQTASHRAAARAGVRDRCLLRVGRLIAALAGVAGVSVALAAPVADRLTLLVPDDANLSSWQVKVWTDSAAEEGLRLDVITDAQLLAMGATAPGRIAGLVVPDSAHLNASDAVVAAIKQFAYLGGKLMLVYDAGVLTDGGTFPLSGNSRFADMVGIDYALWNNGAGAATMVGFGPVVGTQARLDALSFAPGKYLPYTAPATLASTINASTAFVAVSPSDPSATKAMAPTIKARPKGADDGSHGVRARRAVSLRKLLGLGTEASPAVRYGVRNLMATPARDLHVYDLLTYNGTEVGAALSTDTTTSTELVKAAGAKADSTLQAISGYAFGALNYFSYVTTGSYPGTVQLSSPEHGLVAGNRSYGSGQVLFVNLPLGYFKAIGTDGAPLHGYLSAFARDQVGIASMSVQPRGVGGLVYNWHVDDGDDLTSNVKQLLDKTDVFKRGPFSIHFTAGPDVIAPGDGLGMNLPANTAAQGLVRRLGSIGVDPKNALPPHVLGSHGGWIHDFWGANASEANVPDLTPLLQQNFDAIEQVTGRRIREYSSPAGNTPLWALRWLENRGVVATYLVGDVGTAAVRSWRGGERVSDKLWSFPVSPLGKYATFEEFEDFGITDKVSGQWLLDLQSFAVNHRTNRLFYNHPPGALDHLGPVKALLKRGEDLQKSGKFLWYTMSGLADFSQRRVETTWTTATSGNALAFSARHPVSLADETWLLPRARFDKPSVVTGKATVAQDAKNWIVSADGGLDLSFTAIPR